MKKFNLFLILLIVAIFSVTILNSFRVFNLKPDLFIICLCFASLYFEYRWALALSVFSGLLKDIFSFNTFGINTLIFCILSFLILKLIRQISIEDNWMRMSLVFIVAFTNNILSGLILAFSGSVVPFGVFLRIIVFSSLYTTLVSFLFFKFIPLKQ